MSPASLARLSGSLVLSLVVLGPFAILYVPSVVYVPGDPAASVAALSANAQLATVGALCELLIAAIELVLPAALLSLFWDEDRFGALLMAASRATMGVLQFTNALPALLAVALVGGVAGLDAPAVEGWVSVTSTARELGVLVWALPFALHLATLAALVWRSRLVPRWFAPGLAIAGVAYLADSLAGLLAPELVVLTDGFVGLAALLGELPLFLWMLAFGVQTRA